MQRSFVQDRPCGFQRITGLSPFITLSPPPNAISAIITVENSSVRWRDDGIPPTAFIGYPLAQNDELDYSGDPSRLQFVDQSSGAILSISYYGGPIG